MNAFLKTFARIFYLDLRSLALFRVLLGLTILVDLGVRSRFLTAHYTDLGVLPRAALSQFPPSWQIELLALGGEPWFAATLFALHALVAGVFILGFHTRIATLLLWVLTVSLHNRNALVLNGGDALLRLALFWSMFLPLGRKFSLDTALSKRTENEEEVTSVASAAFILQLLFVYLSTVVLKDGASWRVNFTAVELALNNLELAKPAARYLTSWPLLMRVLTVATLACEALLPLLVLLPTRRQVWRVVAIAGFVLLHLGFALFLELGMFSLVSIVYWVALLPGWFWQRVLERSERRERLEIYYDGDCAFCEKLVRIIAVFVGLPLEAIVPAQSKPFVYELMKRENSWVVIVDGVSYLRFQALEVVLRRSNLFRFLPFVTLALTWSRNPGDKAYKWVASHRPLFGTLFTPLRIRDGADSKRFAERSNVLIFGVLAVVVLVNVRALRLDQKWNMFSPAPPQLSGWFVIAGRLADGNEVDVFRNGAPVSYDKPSTPSAEYPNDRWRKYMMQIWRRENKRFQTFYGQYVCRAWNAAHSNSQHLRSARFVYVWHRIELEKPVNFARPSVIFEWTCQNTPSRQD